MLEISNAVHWSCMSMQEFLNRRSFQGKDANEIDCSNNKVRKLYTMSTTL